MFKYFEILESTFQKINIYNFIPLYKLFNFVSINVEIVFSYLHEKKKIIIRIIQLKTVVSSVFSARKIYPAVLVLGEKSILTLPATTRLLTDKSFNFMLPT